MPSRLSIYAEKIIEAGWLAVLIVAPLFFNPYSNRVFNLSNVALVRTLALAMLAAWLILRAESATTHTTTTQLTYLDSFTTKTQRSQSLCVLCAFVVRIRSLFRLRIPVVFSIWSRGNPLTLPALFLIVAYIISTLASVSPNTSVFGSYDRTQGLYTTFSYVLIFFLAASTIRSRGQIARAVNVALVVSFPVAFYGVIQHYALDPLSWPHGASPGRVTSTIGNPAFLGAYLILIIPLTLMRLIAQTEQLANHMHSASTARRNYADSFTTKTQGSQRLGILVSWWFKHAPFSAALYGGVVVSCVGLAALWGLSFDLGAKSMIGTGAAQMLTPTMLKAAQANFNLALGISVIVLLVWCIAGVLIKCGGNGLLIGVYALLLALQVIGLWFTQSRGPFVGLLGGLFTFAVLYLLVRGARRSAFGVLGAILALLAFLVLFSSAASSLVPTGDPYMKRLARTFSTEGGTTAQVRALIWEGALRLALPHAPLWSPTTGDDRLNALRPLIGYGPESMYAAYNQFYPPELARVEVRTAKPDRAHNETLDAFVQTGLLGAAAYLLLFSSICYLGCKWLGFIATPRDRNVFIALWLVGGILLTLIFGFAFGWHFLGVALPTGMLVGFFVYVFAFAGRELWSDAVKKLFSRLTARRSWAAKRAGSNLGEASALRTPARSTLLVTLLAALIGHWLEIQFGVAHTATRSYFWFFAALLISVGVRQLPEFEPAQEVSSLWRKYTSGFLPPRHQDTKPSCLGVLVVKIKESPPASASIGGSTAALIGFGLFTGLILAIMAFDFVSTQNASVPLAGARALDVVVVSLTSKNTTDGIYPSLAMFWLFAGTMLVALAVGAWEWRNGLVRFDDWLLAIGLLVLTALAIFSAFIFYTFFIMSVDSLDALVSTFPYFVLFLIAIVLVSAISLVYEHPLPRAALARRWSWVVVPIALMIGIVLIAATNISIVQADIAYKQAPRFALDAEGAITPFQQALTIQPAQEYAFVFLSNAYLAQARESTGPAQRNELLARAEQALLRAWEINPLASDHTILLAQLHGTWAALTVVPAEKNDHFRKSLAYYAQATRLSPNAAHLYDQYAQALLDAAAFLEQQDSSGAVEARRNAREQLARALALDPTFCLTFAIRAGTQSTWTGTARDALDALNYVPLCRSHGDPFEQQARTLALQSLSSAGERAGAAGEGAAYASLLEAEARAHPSVDLYMTLADYYARDGAIEAAIRATEAGIARIPADDQATRQRYADLADSLRAQRDAGRH